MQATVSGKFNRSARMHERTPVVSVQQGARSATNGIESAYLFVVDFKHGRRHFVAHVSIALFKPRREHERQVAMVNRSTAYVASVVARKIGEDGGHRANRIRAKATWQGR